MGRRKVESKIQEKPPARSGARLDRARDAAEKAGDEHRPGNADRQDKTQAI
jgi:hypothetical protein